MARTQRNDKRSGHGWRGCRLVADLSGGGGGGMAALKGGGEGGGVVDLSGDVPLLPHSSSGRFDR